MGADQEFLHEQLIEPTDGIIGEIREDLQGTSYEIPSIFVESWEEQPFKERVPEGLTYELAVDSRIAVLADDTKIEIRRYKLHSGYTLDPSEEGRHLQWDWILELRDSGEATLSAYEWSHHFTPEGNSGSRKDDACREATVNDVRMFSRFLAVSGRTV